MLGLKVAVLSAYAGAGAYLGYYCAKGLVDFCEAVFAVAVAVYRRKAVGEASGLRGDR